MVPPTGLADTVTPPSFSPAAELIDPLRSGSSALAAVMKAIIAVSIVRKAMRLLFMMLSPLMLHGSARGRRRSRCLRGGNRFQIGDDGLDVGGLEMVFEAGHSRRPVADDFA